MDECDTILSANYLVRVFGFTEATYTLSGAPAKSIDRTDGYVFSRTDKSEFRWVSGTNNVWIPESCAIALGGASLSDSWSDLNAIAPGFDQAENPCP